MAPPSSAGVALVTGAAKRIGRAVALRLGSQGFDIAVHYGASADEAQVLVATLQGLGLRAAAIGADLRQPDSVQALVHRARAALGPLRVLVNNAAVFVDDRLPSLSLPGLRLHLDTNLLSPLVLSQAFAAQPDLPTDAAIVNLIDQRVLKPSPPFFSYGLSKAALWYATRTLAQELAPRIRVNAVGPGPVLPSIHQRPADFEHEAQSTLLQHAVSPEEIAEAVAYLVNSPSVTGQMICVDAGQHLLWRTPDMEGL
jgi:NAD(P)-dependent dehydrogenase (short-subunit alcohol dehydrogenase family)